MGNFTIAYKFLKSQYQYEFEASWILVPSEYTIKDFSGISLNDFNVQIMSNVPINKKPVSLTITPETIDTLQVTNNIIDSGQAFININRRNTRYFSFR